MMFDAGASIGAAMAGPDHTTSDLLLRDADFAMYRAKQAGGGRYEIFDKHLEILRHHSAGARARTSDRGRISGSSFFSISPSTASCGGMMEGFESFLSLRRADGTVDSFSDLLAVAEDNTLSMHAWAARRLMPPAPNCAF